ncbi:proteases secretion protein PrtE [Maritalea myrionectae]|uniref:Membrane fusion protein (MFP) family protein n=1 Tax=Maritalea myrionectae TaxID=454601 RepID=A0A2R4MBS4_9HYPH|nr:HlyD family type I secretion periplasmic adaptor subunit [Maritalea myrionectae]AVX03477.1 proteases secretion protein PrtE [Maritalea myrionectae]
MTENAANQVPNLNFRRPVLLGLIALVVLFGGSVAWSMTARISGAVLASGTVIVQGKPKSIQHLDGGIVEQILVNTGDFVEKDQLLIKLDDTAINANLAIYEGRLREALVKQARLQAELEGNPDIIVPSERLDKLGLGDVTGPVGQQIAMMEARYSTIEAQLAAQDERVEQFQNQIDGVSGLIFEKRNQITGFDGEYSSTSELVDKELVPKSRLIAIERARSDLRGQIAEHRAEIARVENSISETRIKKLQINREFKEKVISELEDINVRIEELIQQLNATRAQLARVRIKAPISGLIHELALNTIGGVVQPGQILMQIIEQKGDFEIELNIDTVSIDQIYDGQNVVIRFPAFNQRTTPELDGTLKSISPTSVVDEKSGFSFYRAIVELSKDEFDKLEEKKLVSGMPVEGVITTQERTVFTYLTKPMTDNLVHVFREE